MGGAGIPSAGADIHGGVVGQDGLLLEVELLENIRLEGLLGFCGGVLSAGMFGSRDCVFLPEKQWDRKLTAPPELDGGQRDGYQDRVREPFLLNNGDADNEQAGGDVDAVDILFRAQRFLGSHCDRWLSAVSLSVNNAHSSWRRESCPAWRSGMNWSAFEPRGKPVKVRILCWEEEHARLSQASTAEPESAHTDQDARVLGRVFFWWGTGPEP